MKSNYLKKRKTVYVFGAGFSREANLPLQAEILDRVKEFDLGILSGQDNQQFLEISKTFFRDKKLLDDFLNKVFSQSKNPSLEDIFTLLDQTINKKSFCHGFYWQELDDIRDALKRSILLVFHDAQERFKQSKCGLYANLAAHLIKDRIAAGYQGDPFSIISVNWDALFDDAIYECLGKSNSYKKIDVDYCCFTLPLDKKSPHTTSILQKVQKIYNIKLLKLHGATNWLSCPNCGRLYTGIGSKLDAYSLYASEIECGHCSGLMPTGKGKAPKLEPFIITPTYLKVFDNPHIQMIWHNAHTELAEAGKIVFVGYSLPEADYHLRTLLKRTVKTNTPIDVVLTHRDHPDKSTREEHKKYFATTRYNNFFSSNQLKFHLIGTKRYFNSVVGKTKTSSQLTWIKRQLKSSD